MRRTALLACCVLLAACGSQGGDDAAPAAEASYGDKDMIELQPLGLAVPAQDGDEAMQIPFGSLREATEATLAGVLGRETRRARNDECPSGPMEVTEYAGMALYFAEGKFAGWFASAPYVPDVTRDVMEQRGEALMVEDSTLGSEFTLGDPSSVVISGVFASDAADAPVESLWAGQACIFR